jgi:hypothetical protein
MIKTSSGVESFDYRARATLNENMIIYFHPDSKTFILHHIPTGLRIYANKSIRKITLLVDNISPLLDWSSTEINYYSTNGSNITAEIEKLTEGS